MSDEDKGGTGKKPNAFLPPALFARTPKDGRDESMSIYVHLITIINKE